MRRLRTADNSIRLRVRAPIRADYALRSPQVLLAERPLGKREAAGSRPAGRPISVPHYGTTEPCGPPADRTCGHLAQHLRLKKRRLCAAQKLPVAAVPWNRPCWGITGDLGSAYCLTSPTEETFALEAKGSEFESPVGHQLRLSSPNGRGSSLKTKL